MNANAFSKARSVFSRLTFLVAIFCAALVFPARNDAATINYNGKGYFIDGFNVPWRSFGADVGAGQYNAAWFETFFTDMQAAGVNCARLWIHCDGWATPNFDASGNVTGVNASFYTEMDDILTRARNHNVMLMPCLWSFDMCNNLRGSQLISNQAKTQSYINNVLRPMVQRYANTPNLFAWEVINEPEWAIAGPDGNTTYTVQRSEMQRFCAMICEAVHQNSGKMVTIGSASLKWNSDHPSCAGNWWKNSALQAAYNSAQAYVDFYQVHYYDWMNQWGYDPFNTSRPTSFWGLDKPTLVGEAPGRNGIYTVSQMINNCYNNGYIGFMPWSYTDTCCGSYAESKDALKAFRDAHVSIVDFSSTTPPSAPSSLAASSVSSSQINLSWTDNSGNETGFKIERKTGSGGTYSQIGTVGANVTTFQNTGLAAGTTYFYRVRANNSGGDSAYSNEASATTGAASATTVNDNTLGTGQNQFEYVSAWSYSSGFAGKYQNDDHYSSAVNAYVNFRFTGTQVKYYGKKASHHGMAGVSIDGGAETSVDLYAATAAEQVLLYSSPILSAGSHTLKIRVTGNKNASSSGTVIAVDKTEISTSGIVSGTVYRLTPKIATTRCLDVSGNSTADGAQVQIWDFLNGNNQKWRVTDVGGGYYKLVPQHATTKALDVNGAGTANGTKIQIWTDNGSAAQKWKIVDTGGGWFKLQPMCAPTSCLDVKASGTANGTLVQLYSDSGNDAQRWRLE